MTIAVSVIVATIGRASLTPALQSLADQPLGPADEVIVVGADTPAIRDQVTPFGYQFLGHPPGGNWGYTERVYGIARATGTHLAFLDDDDVFLPGALAAMHAVIEANPDAPILFRMVAPWGEILWRRPLVREGNVGGGQFVFPNTPARMGTFSARYEGDYDFIVSTLARYPDGALVWDETVTYGCGARAVSPTEAAS